MKYAWIFCALYGAWAIAGCESPRATYSRHVLSCPQCNDLTRPLCPKGEALRQAARDHDGLRDPVLDAPAPERP